MSLSTKLRKYLLENGASEVGFANITNFSEVKTKFAVESQKDEIRHNHNRWRCRWPDGGLWSRKSAARRKQG